VQVTGIYKLDMDQEMAHVAASEKKTQCLWHRRLLVDHLCRKSMKFLAGGVATGIEFSDTDREPRAACIKDKHSTVVFKPSRNITTQKLKLIHSDVCGPVEEESWGGARFVLTLTGDFTRKICAYTMTKESEIKETVKEFKTIVENQARKKMKVLRTDNGGECVNSDLLQDCLKVCAIVSYRAVPHKPEQNVVVRCGSSLHINARPRHSSSG
jgi:hypothetical protein